MLVNWWAYTWGGLYSGGLIFGVYGMVLLRTMLTRYMVLKRKQGEKRRLFKRKSGGKTQNQARRQVKKISKGIMSTKSDVSYLGTWVHVVHLETWIFHYPDGGEEELVVDKESVGDNGVRIRLSRKVEISGR